MSEEVIFEACKKIVACDPDKDHTTFMYCIDGHIIIGDVVKNIHEINLSTTAQGKLMGTPQACAAFLEGVGMSYFCTVKHVLGFSNEQFVKIMAKRMLKNGMLNHPPRHGFRLLNVHLDQSKEKQ